MEFDILYLSNKKNWLTYKYFLNKINGYSPYYTLSFFSEFSHGTDNLICFVGKTKNGGVILLPGYIQNISLAPNYYDFTSPYGYSGPICNSQTSEADKTLFWKKIDNWYYNNNIVSEFIRFSLDGNYKNYSGSLHPTLLNVKGAILDKENQWQNFERKVRKNINRANKEGVIFKIFSGQQITKKQLTDFYTTYINTMKRKNALFSFHYSYETFNNYIKTDYMFCVLALVYDKSNCISSELALKSKNTIYSFLGGTDKDGFSKRPNDFLKYSLINWARENNIKYYVLGGGYGQNDGIFQFKKSFFPGDITTYYTGRKIINKQIYNELIKKRFGAVLPESSFFPLYRL